MSQLGISDQLVADRLDAPQVIRQTARPAFVLLGEFQDDEAKRGERLRMLGQYLATDSGVVLVLVYVRE